jgi:hypothetical protein
MPVETRGEPQISRTADLLSCQGESPLQDQAMSSSAQQQQQQQQRSSSSQQQRSSYLISVSILNIGRYMEMMITPTIIPTAIIMIGSMIDVSVAIDESTSSS